MSLFDSDTLLFDLVVEVLILGPGYAILRVIKRLRGIHTETSPWLAFPVGAVFWACVIALLWMWLKSIG